MASRPHRTSPLVRWGLPPLLLLFATALVWCGDGPSPDEASVFAARPGMQASSTLEVLLPPTFEAPLSVRRGGASVTLVPLEARAARAVRDGERTVYAGAWPGTEVVYRHEARRLKELLHLTTDSPRRFAWRLATGLTVRPERDGGLGLLDGAGVLRLTIDRPFVDDAEGVRTWLAWSLEDGVLSVSVPEGLAMPAVLDPTIGVPTWTRLADSPVLPPAREGGMVAWDPIRGQVVLFGGDDGTLRGDTWVWSAADGLWSDAAPVTAPPARRDGALAWDPAGTQLVLFGGLGGAGRLGDTWAWDGADWALVDTTAGAPSARERPGVVTVGGASSAVFIFGGLADTGVLDDTWVWNAGWVEIPKGTTSPPGRADAGLAHDPVRNRVVLFGGESGGTALLDTWEHTLSTVSWSQPSTTSPPAARWGHAMGYDPGGKTTVVFGGTDGTTTWGDTWSWNGASWSEATVTGLSARSGVRGFTAGTVLRAFGGTDTTPRMDLYRYLAAGGRWRDEAVSPTARRDHVAGLDPSTGRVWIFGGAGPGLLGDVWAWDPLTPGWLRTEAAGPTARSGHAGAWTTGSATPGLVIHGGIDATGPVGDTWRYDPGTSSWTELTGAGPGARSGAVAAVDEATGTFYLFGGLDGDGSTFLGELWSLDSTGWTAHTPAPSPRARAAAAWDPVNARLLVHGGDDGTLRGDLLAWDAGTDTWSDVTPGTVPGPRKDHTAVWDVANGELLLFGGHDGTTTLDELWAGDPTGGFTQVAPATAPGARAGARLVHDGTSNQSWLTGGEGTSLLQEVWRYTTGIVPRSKGPATIAAQEGLLSTTVFTAEDPDTDPTLITWSSSPLPTGATFTFDATGATLAWTPDYTQAGTYPVTLTVSDGTFSSTWDVTITVSDTNRPPTIIGTADQAVDEGATLTLTISATEPDGEPVTYGIANPLTGMTIDPSTGAFSWTPTYQQAGVYNVGFTASDGNSSVTDTVVITVVNVRTDPVIQPIPDQTVAEEDTLVLTPVVSDADGDSMTLGFSGRPQGASFDSATGTLTWTPRVDQAGNYTVTFSASDGVVTVTADANIAVTNKDLPPILGAIGNRTVAPGETLSILVAAYEPDGQTVTYTATGLPTGATLQPTGLFEWTPATGDVGDHPVTFSASDGTLTDSEAVVISVVEDNAAPVLSPLSDTRVAEGQQLTFTVGASDADGDTLTLSAEGLPTGATFTAATGTFDWTPDYDQAGRWSVTFVASDGLAEDRRTVGIDVDPTNRAPTLESVGDRSLAIGELLTFTLVATDPDGDTLTFSASGLPEGADLDAVSGVFNWAPGSNDIGTHDITFGASDGTAQALETVVFTVSATTVTDGGTGTGDGGTGDGGDGGTGGGKGEGCGCSTTDEGQPSVLWSLGLLVFAWRRRSGR